MQECVRGSLKGKTIILVTHQIDFLQNVDLIVASPFYDLLMFCLSQSPIELGE